MERGRKQPVGGAAVAALVLATSALAIVGVLTEQSVAFWFVLLAFAMGALSYLTPTDELDRWLNAQALRVEFGGTTSTGSTTEREVDARDPDAALQTARQRYASGEIDEARFEVLIEDLLETETVEDVRERQVRTVVPEPDRELTVE